MIMINLLLLGIVGGLLALITSYFYATKVNKYEINDVKVEEITEAIREGAMAFLHAEYKVLIWFVLGASILLGVF